MWTSKKSAQRPAARKGSHRFRMWEQRQDDGEGQGEPPAPHAGGQGVRRRPHPGHAAEGAALEAENAELEECEAGYV